MRNIESGSKVLVSGHGQLGEGKVLVQNENTGKCLVKFNLANVHGDPPLHDAGGLLREQCSMWIPTEDIQVIAQPYESVVRGMDPRRDWAVMMVSIDGRLTVNVRYGGTDITKGIDKEMNEATPVEAMRMLAEKTEKLFGYIDGMKADIPKPIHPDGELVNGKAVYINTRERPRQSNFTVGKVYEFKNGKFVDDAREERPYGGLTARERDIFCAQNFVLLKDK